MHIYDNVKIACKENGISVSELEKELNFARSSIYKWNRNRPSAEKLKKVAKRLNKPMEYFLKNNDKCSATQEPYIPISWDVWGIDKDGDREHLAVIPVKDDIEGYIEHVFKYFDFVEEVEIDEVENRYKENEKRTIAMTVKRKDKSDHEQ